MTDEPQNRLDENLQIAEVETGNDEFHTFPLKKAEFLRALKENMCIVSAAANRTTTTRRTHYNWMKEDEDYRIVVEEMQDVPLDFAENKLLSKIREGDTASIIFYLKCKGKKRGYVERSEHVMVDDTFVDFTEV